MIRVAGVVPPGVVTKDLRLRMRGWRWAGVATLYVGILVVIAAGFLVHKYQLSPSDASQAGAQLLQTLAIFQLFLIVFVTPATMAGAISGERQQGTWDLLLLSRLSPLDIVWGKLLAGVAFNLVLFAASLPLFGLVFLFGGATPLDLLRVFVVLVATMVLLSATSLAASALTARLVVSFMIGTLIALTLTVGLSLLTLYLQVPGQLSLQAVIGLPLQTFSSPAPLTPLAHLDPLVALLSALPATGGGTLLGSLGRVDHAFGLPWQLPLWGAYTLLGLVISLGLVRAAATLARISPRWQYWGGSR